MLQRCAWTSDDPLMIRYHDREWGVPTHSDRQMFEFLVLETFQAGLSWKTVLHKRENFRQAFGHFDYTRVSKFGNRDERRLLKDVGIIRNRQKIKAAINNARRFQEVRKEFGTFSRYLWGFTEGKTIRNQWRHDRHLPATTRLAKTIAADLKRRGFQFLGPTVVYAHLQATGIVNDHVVSCWRYAHDRRS